MARAEWLRTFVAIYRGGTVTKGALQRCLSQPAASQQLCALERSIGHPLFVRERGGIEPTEWGRELYSRVAAPLDQLEDVLGGLDAGSVARDDPPVQVGASAEFFSARILPRISTLHEAVSARFGRDRDLFAWLESGEVDAVATRTMPSRRSIASVPMGPEPFALVCAPALAPESGLGPISELRGWLETTPWISYSVELPVTRRFWLKATGHLFDAGVAFTAPDLRVVLSAVELGMGATLMPAYVCAEAVRGGSVVHPFEISGLVAAEPWFVSTREGDAHWGKLARVVDLVSGGRERGGHPGG